MARYYAMIISCCLAGALPATAASGAYSGEARQFRTYYGSGALKGEFPYENGKLNGEARWYYESGALGAVMNYRENRLHGESKLFFENGRVKQRAYHENNRPARSAFFYDRSGRLLRQEIHQDGKVTGRWIYGPAGDVSRCEAEIVGEQESVRKPEEQ